MNPAQIGRVLREQRERSGLSLAKIARETNISRRHLEAIESDRLDSLPTGSVGRGFIRQYAGYLGLDAGEFAEAAQHRLSDPDVPTIAPPSVKVPKAARSRTWLWASVATVGVLLILGAVDAFRPTENETPKGVLSDLSTVTGDALAGSTGGGASVTVRVVGQTGTWIEVIEDGRRNAGVKLEPGRSKSFIAERTIFLVLGNPSDVEITANGVVLGTPKVKAGDGLYRATFTPQTAKLPPNETPPPETP